MLLAEALDSLRPNHHEERIAQRKLLGAKVRPGESEKEAVADSEIAVGLGAELLPNLLPRVPSLPCLATEKGPAGGNIVPPPDLEAQRSDLQTLSLPSIESKSRLNALSASESYAPSAAPSHWTSGVTPGPITVMRWRSPLPETDGTPG